MDEIRHQSEVRLVEEREHYKRLYDIDDHFDPTAFDVIIDTTDLDQDQVLQKMLDELQPHLESV